MKKAKDNKTIKNFVKGLLLAIRELLNSSQNDLLVLCIDSADVSAVKIKKSINSALIYIIQTSIPSSKLALSIDVE